MALVPPSSRSRSSRATRGWARPSAPEGPELRPRGSRARRSGTIVVVLGIDGAGKTTTVAALAAAERASGRPAIVLRNRSGRRWLARTSARLGVDLPVLWADRFETVVRAVNVLVSAARQVRRRGLVLVDRHLVCQLVLRRVRGLPPGRFLPGLAAGSLRADAVVVLDVPAESALERILVRGEDHESLAYLRAARSAYLEIARARGWSVVDATGTTEAVLARVARAIGR